jgi:hypothetical protein
MNNYTGFNFLPSPTRPASRKRHVHVASPATMSGMCTTEAATAIGLEINADANRQDPSTHELLQRS